jgi:hypothetical protein
MIIFLPAVEATLPSMSTAVQKSSAERRTSGRPRPPSPRCQHPYVAGSFTLPFPRHACHRARKDARRHEERIPVETSRPAIPKAWPRNLAVAPGSALVHSGACWPQRDPDHLADAQLAAGTRDRPSWASRTQVETRTWPRRTAEVSTPLQHGLAGLREVGDMVFSALWARRARSSRVPPQGRPPGAPMLTTASLVCLDRPERDQPNPDVDRECQHPPRGERQEQQY